MFTGIVEALGVVESIQRVELNQGPVVRLVVVTDLDVEAMPIGASIAVDGVCLTIVERAAGHFAADLGPETLALTTLGSARARGAASTSNGRSRSAIRWAATWCRATSTSWERSWRARPAGASLELDIAAPAQVARFLAAKGSVAVDGVSLTVNTVAGDVFSVTLIPHTLEVTKLGDKQVGDTVNLEADMIVKHIDRLVAAQFGGARSDARPHPAPRDLDRHAAEVRLCPLNRRRERHAAVARAIEAIRAGGMVILVDDEDRENEGDLVMAADLVTPEAINFMAREGRGLICLSLTEERVAQLGLTMMAADNRSPRHTAFTVSIDGAARDHHRHLGARAGRDGPRRGGARRAARRHRHARARLPAEGAAGRRAGALGPHRRARSTWRGSRAASRPASSARSCARTARWRACPTCRRSRASTRCRS